MLGFVNLLKPAGPTSTQVGARLRRLFARPGAGKLAIGHLGTLDPQAAGVLPIALGKATRLLALIEDRRKVYVCTLIFGRATDTADATGATIATAPVPADLAARLAAAAAALLGTSAQTPPMYSAVHLGGIRLYELARAGKIVDRPSRPITVERLDVLGCDGGVARLRIACSEGTYVRTLCEDLAVACGTVGHMGALLRERAGPFDLARSVTLDEVAADPAAAVVPPQAVIPLPTVVLDDLGAHDFRAGRSVPLPYASRAARVFVHDAAHELVGVGEPLGALLAPRRVLT